jgi:hypothetical protein
MISTFNSSRSCSEMQSIKYGAEKKDEDRIYSLMEFFIPNGVSTSTAV